MMQVILRQGNLYMLQGRDPSKLFNLCNNTKNQGGKILCITRIHPNQLKEEYGIPQDQTIWISQTVGSRNINPQNMGILTETVVRFLSTNVKSIVFLEGLEYLMAQNDFTKILKFINHVYEAVAINKSIMVFSMDPRAFSAREIAFLEKCAVAIDENDEVIIRMSD
ncbi:MAG: DUF835 domain-containing protein [Methanomassiliicoccales archaeon]|jgi:hypothetical protein|nr:DUF835 domain-containing protein [Methanomassiliicoccales archaeon]